MYIRRVSSNTLFPFRVVQNHRWISHFPFGSSVFCDALFPFRVVQNHRWISHFPFGSSVFCDTLVPFQVVQNHRWISHFPFGSSVFCDTLVPFQVVQNHRWISHFPFGSSMPCLLLPYALSPTPKANCRLAIQDVALIPRSPPSEAEPITLQARTCVKLSPNPP